MVKFWKLFKRAMDELCYYGSGAWSCDMDRMMLDLVAGRKTPREELILHRMGLDR